MPNAAARHESRGRGASRCIQNGTPHHAEHRSAQESESRARRRTPGIRKRFVPTESLSEFLCPAAPRPSARRFSDLDPWSRGVPAPVPSKELAGLLPATKGIRGNQAPAPFPGRQRLRCCRFESTYAELPAEFSNRPC